MNRKRIFWVLIVIIVAAAGWFLFKQFYPGTKGSIQNKIPNYFTKIISETNISVQAVGDSTKLPGEIHRAIVSYKSQLSMTQNQDYFSEYFKKNNFETQVKDSNDSLTISGTKQKTSLSVTIWKRNPVQISILYILNK